MKSSEPARLLILAASEYQLPVIEQARQMGYYIVTIDNVPTNPGHALANQHYIVSTTDQEAILSIARRERIDGILAACTDVAVPTAAYVGRQLNLPAPAEECARVLCDKINFRRFLHEHDLPVPAFHSIETAAEVIPLLTEGCSYLIKPAQASGSKGIIIIRSDTFTDQLFTEAQQQSIDGRVLVEEMLPGKQGTAEGFMTGGKLSAFFVFDRTTAPAPHVATWGHTIPATLSAQAEVDLKRQLLICFQRLNYTDGPFDCDFVSRSNGVALIEVTPRMGGNSITRFLQYAYDFPIARYSVLQAVGEQVKFDEPVLHQPTAVVILGVMERGQLEYDTTEYEKLTAEPWLRYLQLDRQIGDTVAPFINGRYRVGEAILTGATPDQLRQNISRFTQRLALRAMPTPQPKRL